MCVCVEKGVGGPLDPECLRQENLDDGGGGDDDDGGGRQRDESTGDGDFVGCAGV